MNKQQKNYAMAKAFLETLEAEGKQLERKFIRENKIVNSDGSMPEQIYEIDVDDIFEEANLKQSETPEAKKNWEEILDARKLLKSAEEDLICYGLSIAPKKQKEILTKAAKTDYTTRVKIIDLVMKLDTRTVKAI